VGPGASERSDALFFKRAFSNLEAMVPKPDSVTSVTSQFFLRRRVLDIIIAIESVVDGMGDDDSH